MDRQAIEHILDQIDAAETARDNQEHRRLLHILANRPDEVLNLLQETLREPDKDYWPTAVEAIEAIGYPRNAPALPLIIVHAADANSPASFNAIQMLKRLPQNVLKSELIAVFWPTQANGYQRDSHDGEWVNRVSSVCLVSRSLGIQYCRILGPTLIYFLSQPTYRRQLRPSASEEILPWSVFDVLEVIKDNLLPYAVPVLLDLAVEEKAQSKEGRAMALVRSLGAQVLNLYSHVPLFDSIILNDQPEP